LSVFTFFLFGFGCQEEFNDYLHDSKFSKARTPTGRRSEWDAKPFPVPAECILCHPGAMFRNNFGDNLAPSEMFLA